MLLALSLLLGGLGFSDSRLVRGLLVLSVAGGLISAIGILAERKATISLPFTPPPFVGWGHVADKVVGWAVWVFLLSELGEVLSWESRSFWVEGWKVTATAGVGGYLVVLIWQVLRGCQVSIIVTSIFGMGASIGMSLAFAWLGAKVIRFFAG